MESNSTSTTRTDTTNEYNFAVTGHEQLPNPDVSNSVIVLAVSGIAGSIASLRVRRAQETIDKIDHKSAVYGSMLGDGSYEASGADTTPRTIVEKLASLAIANVVNKHSHARVNNYKTQSIYYPVSREWIPTEKQSAQAELGKSAYLQMFGEPMPQPEPLVNPTIYSASDLIRTKRRFHPKHYSSMLSERFIGYDHLSGTTKTSKKLAKSAESARLFSDNFDANATGANNAKIAAEKNKLGHETYRYTSKKEQKFARKLELRKNLLVESKIGKLRKMIALRTIEKSKKRIIKNEDLHVAMQENKVFRIQQAEHLNNVKSNQALHGPFKPHRY